MGDAFWEWIYQHDFERYNLGNNDADDFLSAIFGGMIGTELYSAMVGSNITLFQLHEIFENLGEIEEKIDEYECEQCGHNFIEAESDNPIRSILDISDDSLLSVSCSDCEQIFCSEDCHDDWHANDEEDNDEDSEDEEEDEEEDDSDNEEDDESDESLLSSDNDDGEGKDREPERVDVAGIGPNDLCAICGHRWDVHSHGVMGNCSDFGCRCKAFTTEKQKKEADELSALVREVEARNR